MQKSGFWLITLASLLTPGAALCDSNTALSAYLHNCQTEGVDPDVRIAACTRIIRANILPQGMLADIYVVRAHAYEAKRDYGDALKDDDKALELKPDFSKAQDHKTQVERMLQARGDGSQPTQAAQPKGNP